MGIDLSAIGSDAGMAAALPLIAGAAAPVAGYIGQQQTNSMMNEMNFDTNQNADQQALQAQNFSANQVAQQEQFQNQQVNAQEAYQTQMSDTSYQRGVADLKAAGLNPLMAQMNGGSSTPSGASMSGGAASGVAAPQQRAPYSSPVSALSGLGDLAPKILSMAQTAAQIDNTKASTNLTNAQAAKTSVDTDVSKNAAQEGGVAASLMNDVKVLYDKAKGAISTGAKSFGNTVAPWTLPTPDPGNTDQQQQIDLKAGW